MFVENLRTIGTLENFQQFELVISLANQIFVLVISGLFVCYTTLFSGLLFLLLMVFNHFHFKMRILSKTKYKKFIQNGMQDRIYCDFRERIAFFVIFCTTFIMILYKLIILLIQKYSLYWKQKEAVFEETGIKNLLFNFQRLFTKQQGLDWVLGVSLLIYSYIIYRINLIHFISYNKYKIYVYRSIFRYLKAPVLLSIFVLLVFKKLKFQSSYLGIIENFVIIFFFADFFFKFKEGTLQNLHKYIRLLKYVTILRIIVIYCAIINHSFVSKRYRLYDYYFVQITNEVDYLNDKNKKGFFVLITMYILFNYFNFISKFEHHFQPLNKKIKYNELFQRPYNLFFIKDFPKKLIEFNKKTSLYKILNHKLDLKYEYYQDLKSLHFFRKSFDIYLKSEIEKEQIPKSFYIFEFFNKYKIIFNIYKFEIFKIVLDIIMIIALFSLLNEKNIFSMLYFALVIILVINNNFKTIWNACLIFCLFPNLIIMFINITLFTSQYLNNRLHTQIQNLLQQLVPQDRDKNLFLVHSLLFILNSFYLYGRYFIWKWTKKDVNRSLVQNLRDRRLTVLEADEDLLYILKSIFKIFIIIAKYFIIYQLFIDSLSKVNILNFILLVFLFVYFINTSKNMYKILIYFYLLMIMIKYFSSFQIFFQKIENHFKLVYGLNFDPQRYDFVEEQQQTREHIQFFYHIVTAYALFQIKNIEEQISKERLIETRIFKTKYISEIYNYILELMIHCKYAIDSTKIYFVYFVIFYFASKDDKNILDFGEFVFTVFMLCFHIQLYRKQGNVKSKIFLFFFQIYFIILLVLFLYTYYFNFKIFFLQDFLIEQKIEKLSDFYALNFQYLFSISLKLILTIISLKSIYQEIWPQQNNRREQQYFQNLSNEKNLNYKFYYQLFRLISVFVKEFALFYTFLAFLKSPNFFGLLYLSSYLYYFYFQIKSLLKKVRKFQIYQLLNLKLKYFKLYIMNPQVTIQNVEIDFFSEYQQKLGVMYQYFFQKKIFNSIYKYVDKNWTFNFFIIVTYLTMVYIKSFKTVYDEQEYTFVEAFFFNFKDYQVKTLREEFQKVTIVLFVTVMEIYFIKVLEQPKKENEKVIEKFVIDIYKLRYQLLIHRAENHNEPLTEEEHKKSKIFVRYLKSLRRFDSTQIDLQIKEIVENEEKKYGEDSHTEYATNLNQNLTKIEKCVLSFNNKSKMNYLMVSQSFLHICQKMLFIPIIMGTIFSLRYSPFKIIGVVILVQNYFQQDFISEINWLNILIAFLSLFEYLILILPEIFANFLKLKIFQSKDSFIFIELLKLRPISGLVYIFLYAGFFKLFFMLMVLVCKYTFMKIDFINKNFLLQIRKTLLQGDQYLILSYQQWSQNQYHIFYKIKNHILINLGNYFFLSSFLFYLQSFGYFEIIALIVLFFLKIYVTLYLNKPFSDSLSKEYSIFYKILVILNWAIFFTNLFQLTVLDNKNVVKSSIVIFQLAMNLKLSMIILDISKNKNIYQEYEKVRNYFYIRSVLKLYGDIYHQNEQKIIQNAQLKQTGDFLNQKYLKNQAIQINNKEQTNDELLNKQMKDLSLFLDSNQYEKFLYKQLGYWNGLFFKIKLFLRNNLFKTKTVSNNFFCLSNDFIQNNKVYLGQNSELDLFDIVNQNLRSIEGLIDRVKINSQEFYKSKRHNNELKQKIDEFEQFRYLTRTYTTNQDNRESRRMTQAASINAVNFIIKKLTNDDQSNIIKNAKNGTFFDNTYKYKMSQNSYLILKNYDLMNLNLTDPKFDNFSFIQYLKAVMVLIYDQLEKIIGLMLIVILTINSGVFNSLIFFYFLFFVLIENKINNLKHWEILYSIFIFGFLVKTYFRFFYRLQNIDQQQQLFQNTSYLKNSQAAQLLFMFGKINNFRTTIILFLFEILFTKICGQDLLNKNLEEVENLYQCLFRVSFNNGWQRVYYKLSYFKIGTINYIEEKVKRLKKQNLQDKDYMIFLVTLIKRKTPLYKSVTEKYKQFQKTVFKLVPIYRRDMQNFHLTNFKNYMWRNFNYTFRKPGINLSNYLLLMLLLLACYSTVFYFQLIGSNQSIWKNLYNDDVPGLLSINFTIFLFFICVERYLYFSNNQFWIESICTEKDQIIALLRGRNSVFSNILQEKYKKRNFRMLVKSIIFGGRLSNRSKYNIKNDYIYNSLIKKFIFTIIVWIYITYLCFFQYPMTGHARKMNSGSSLLFCNDNYKVFYQDKIYAEKCNNFSNNYYLQFFYFLSFGYFVLSIIQIKEGFSFIYYFEKKDFYKVKNIAGFYIYRYFPFLREIKTLIDFMASRSALNIFQWFILEDIDTSLQYAYINEQSNQYRGRQMNKNYKRLSGFSFLFFFFFILMAPLYIFSDIFPNNINNDLTGGGIKVQAFIGKTQWKIFENKELNFYKLTEMSKEFKVIKNDDFYKKFEQNLFWKITFNKKSYQFLELTQENINFIREIFETSRKVDIQINLKINTKYKGIIEKQFKYSLEEELAPVFVKMLTTEKCTQKHNNRILLDTENKLIDLKRTQQKSFEKNKPKQFEFMFLLKFICDQKSDKTSFQLSDDNYENLEFIVLNENIKSSVEILQKISDSTISITSIYIIIFSYIGLTLVRKAFFEQTHKIFTTEIPNADLIEEKVYMISYSRQKSDLYTEEKFYNQLLDLYREPKHIKDLTGEIGLNKNQLK